MKIVILPRAKRSLKKIEKKVAISLLSSFVTEAENGELFQSSRVCKIVGTSFYRYRIKNYRIIFDLDGNVVNVYDVRKRSETTYKIDF